MVLVARATLKAVEAAVNSRQWNKAVQILEVVDDRATCAKYYKKIAQHYANIGEYEVSVSACAHVCVCARRLHLEDRVALRWFQPDPPRTASKNSLAQGIKSNL